MNVGPSRDLRPGPSSSKPASYLPRIGRSWPAASSARAPSRRGGYDDGDSGEETPLWLSASQSVISDVIDPPLTLLTSPSRRAVRGDPTCLGW